jgi:prepilin-type N-terminal cleavage/methylation domain-containing protein
MKKENQVGFTMPEMLAALSVGGIILVIITTALLHAQKNGGEVFSRIQTAREARIIRDKILRGAFGLGSGLRGNSGLLAVTNDTQKGAAIIYQTQSSRVYGLYFHTNGTAQIYRQASTTPWPNSGFTAVELLHTPFTISVPEITRGTHLLTLNYQIATPGIWSQVIEQELQCIY